MQKASVSPLVLFILFIALAVSLVTFFVSLTEKIIETKSSCENVKLQIINVCHSGSNIMIDLLNKGPKIDGLKLIVWGEVESEFELPQSDLNKDSSFKSAIPVNTRVDKVAIIPKASGKECLSNPYIFEEVRC